MLELARPWRCSSAAACSTRATPERATDDCGRRRPPTRVDGAFARASPDGLGAEGVALPAPRRSGPGQFGPTSRVATAARGGVGRGRADRPDADPVDDVLHADVRATGRPYGSLRTVVAAGMAAVLAAGAALPSGGPQTETVARVGRQLLRREHAQGLYAGAGAVPASGTRRCRTRRAGGRPARRAPDAAGPRPRPARRPPSGRRCSPGSGRDGGAALGELIAVGRAGRGAAGDRGGAHRAGGHRRRPVRGRSRRTGRSAGDTVAAVAPALGEAVAAHVDVAVEALWVGRRRLGCRESVDAAAGPGLPDRSTGTRPGRSGGRWASGRVQPPCLDGTGPGTAARHCRTERLPGDAGVRPAARLRPGRREAQETAENREFRLGLDGRAGSPSLVRGPVGHRWRVWPRTTSRSGPARRDLGQRRRPRPRLRSRRRSGVARPSRFAGPRGPRRRPCVGRPRRRSTGRPGPRGAPAAARPRRRLTWPLEDAVTRHRGRRARRTPDTGRPGGSLQSSRAGVPARSREPRLSPVR